MDAGLAERNLQSRNRLALAVAAALLTSGCDLVPGTAAYEEKRARGAAAQLLIDPGSAQFRNVASRDTAICGEINGRNRMGAYVGFTRFWVDTSNWRAALDPQFDYDRLVTARRLCASIGGTSCTDETELYLERAEQDRFDSAWETRCEGSAAGAGSTPAMPWDPTALNATASQENWVEETPPVSNETTSSKDADDEPSGAEDLMGVDALSTTDANIGSTVDSDAEYVENTGMGED
jgi:hypothetical protein